MSHPFLAGQRLTAGQLNDATEKALDSVEVGVAGVIAVTSGTTELNIAQLAMGPVSLVNGGLYTLDIRLTFQYSVATDLFGVIVRRDTALTGTIVADWTIFSQVDTNAHQTNEWDDFTASATESGVLLFVSLKRVSGSGTCSLYGQATATNRTGAKIVRTGYADVHRVVT